MTDAQIIAYAKHMAFNAFMDASKDIRTFGVNGNRFEDRVVPSALSDYKRSPEGRNAGFTYVLIVKDRKGKDAYVVATQDGHFWPLTPSREDGMGALARNEWAAKVLEARFLASTPSTPPDIEALRAELEMKIAHPTGGR